MTTSWRDIFEEIVLFLIGRWESGTLRVFPKNVAGNEQSQSGCISMFCGVIVLAIFWNALIDLDSHDTRSLFLSFTLQYVLFFTFLYKIQPGNLTRMKNRFIWKAVLAAIKLNSSVQISDKDVWIVVRAMLLSLFSVLTAWLRLLNLEQLLKNMKILFGTTKSR